jgi:hypothetical protein
MRQCVILARRSIDEILERFGGNDGEREPGRTIRWTVQETLTVLPVENVPQHEPRWCSANR